jgi:hypothetical protein
MALMPKQGTLERIVLDKMLSGPVTYLDFVGTGVTEENIDQIVQNLRNGMFEAEDDDQVKFDS